MNHEKIFCIKKRFNQIQFYLNYTAISNYRLRKNIISLIVFVEMVQWKRYGFLLKGAANILRLNIL